MIFSSSEKLHAILLNIKNIDEFHDSCNLIGKVNKLMLYNTWHMSLLMWSRDYIWHAFDLQVNLIITLSLGSMKTDHVISESCYNEVIYNRHIAK